MTSSHRTGRSNDPEPRPQITIGSLTMDDMEVAIRPPLIFTATDQTRTAWIERDLRVRLITGGERLDDRMCGRAFRPALVAAVTHEGAAHLQRVGAVLWPRIRAIMDISHVHGFGPGPAISLQELRERLRTYARGHAVETTSTALQQDDEAGGAL